MVSSKLPAALLLAALLAGCSGPAPAPEAGGETASSSLSLAPAPGNRTAAPVPPALAFSGCAGIETITPMPMQDALPLLPAGYVPIPFQAFLGAPAAGQDPAAALFTLTFVCDGVAGAVNGTGQQVAYVGIVVQAPANVTAGPDVAMLDVVASDPAVAALYAGAGFRVQPGQVAFGSTAAGPGVQASATVTGATLSFTQGVAGQAGAQGKGFEGRFFGVKDGKAGGVADFAMPGGVTFNEGAGAAHATQGTLAGQSAGSGYADSFAVPSFALTFHGLPLPPAPQASAS